MQKIMAFFLFYLVSYVGVYLVYVFVEPASSFSIQIAENVRGQNGVSGFIELTIYISVVGGAVLLVNFLCGNSVLKTAQLIEQKGLLAGLKAFFLGNKGN